MPIEEVSIVSAPTCAECKHGTITEHSSRDKCAHQNNTQGYPPYALRHDETLCGSEAAWFEIRQVLNVTYRAVDAVKIA